MEEVADPRDVVMAAVKSCEEGWSEEGLVDEAAEEERAQGGGLLPWAGEADEH